MSKKLEDMKKLTDLTNEFIGKFLETLDPREYDNDREYFINQCLTAPSAIAAEIIDKISGTFQIERPFILKKYIDKTKLALKWVDHKYKGK